MGETAWVTGCKAGVVILSATCSSASAFITQSDKNRMSRFFLALQGTASPFLVDSLPVSASGATRFGV